MLGDPVCGAHTEKGPYLPRLIHLLFPSLLRILLNSYQNYFQIASGVFIIAIGVLLLTNTMNLIAIWAFKNGYFIESFTQYAAAPTYITAIVAGLLSFVSPCVLPLVPAYIGYLSGHTLRQG